jgi:glycerol-3-phosphate dehydrogenase (NAD(P)+)
MRITILGAGNWGTTVAIMLAKKFPVTLWTIEKESIEGRENKKYLPGYKIPENVIITEDLQESLSHAEIIFIAIPCQAVREVARQMKVKEEVILVSGSKGLEKHSLKRMSEVLSEECGISLDRICVLSGPLIAREVVKGSPTSCVVACIDEERARIVQKVFTSPFFRVYTEKDVIGVELGGALKNVIALAAGICDGLNLGANAKGALLTRGIREITRLGVQMGAESLTFAGLSGIGDLITTSFSKHSRNRFVGEQIGRGKQLKEILAQMTEVAEGVSTTPVALELAKRHNVSIPITQEVYEILFLNKPPSQGISNLMSRDPKPEKL